MNAWNDLQRSSFKWPNPVNSETFPGHFKTFKEVEQDPSAFICSDKGLPFSLKVGECEECNYRFMSASERDKHITVIHRQNGSKRKRIIGEHKCLYIIRENKHARRCKLVFKSTYELRGYKSLTGHTRGKKKNANEIPSANPTTPQPTPTPTPQPTRSTSTSTTQRTIIECMTPSPSPVDDNDDEEDDEGHQCSPNAKVNKNTCGRCLQKYKAGSGDWLLCSVCACWYHEDFF